MSTDWKSSKNGLQSDLGFDEDYVIFRLRKRSVQRTSS